jgi:hypothetical protein
MAREVELRNAFRDDHLGTWRDFVGSYMPRFAGGCLPRGKARSAPYRGVAQVCVRRVSDSPSVARRPAADCSPVNWRHAEQEAQAYARPLSPLRVFSARERDWTMSRMRDSERGGGGKRWSVGWRGLADLGGRVLIIDAQVAGRVIHNLVIKLISAARIKLMLTPSRQRVGTRYRACRVPTRTMYGPCTGGCRVRTRWRGLFGRGRVSARGRGQESKGGDSARRAAHTVIDNKTPPPTARPAPGRSFFPLFVASSLSRSVASSWPLPVQVPVLAPSSGALPPSPRLLSPGRRAAMAA